MSLRRPIAIALVSSVALAGLVTVTATGASGAPPTTVQPRAAVTNTSVLTTVKTFLTGTATATGVAVNAVDDTIYVSNSGGGTNNLVVINGITGAMRTLNFGNPVTDVAVNQVDDTVYVPVDAGADLLFAIRGSTDDSSSQPLGGTGSPQQVGVNQIDDTVYVTQGASSQVATLNIFQGANLTRRTLPFTSGSSPRGVAVNDQDDTVYVSLNNNASLSLINGVTDDSQTTGVGTNPYGVGVNQGDDTVYVMNNSSASLSVITGATGAVSRTVPLAPVGPDVRSGVAVDELDDTVYVTISNAIRLWILNGGNLDDSTSILMLNAPRDVAVDDTVGTGRGLVYVATERGLEVVARATPVLSGATTTGSANDTVTVDVTSNPAVSYGFDSGLVTRLRFNGDNGFRPVATPGPLAGQWSVTLPAGLPAGPVTVEAAFQNGAYALAGTYTVLGGSPTITSVSPSSGPTTGGTSVTITGANLSGATSVTFGGTAGVITANTATSITVTTPAGAAGAVNVAVTTPGGTATSAGAFTYGSPAPPPPPPIFPPGPPLNVTAVAGDGQATVSWAPPTSMGDFPITEYEVRSAPGFWPCSVAVPTTSCTVTGLENGTSYTFTVRAKSNAGWGSESSPSNAVTPRPPTILITGSRDRADDRFIRVQGTTTDLVGKQVTPYVRFPGQLNYTAGIGVQTVAADGTFSWSRKTGKRTYVYFAHEEVRSNTVVITAR